MALFEIPPDTMKALLQEVCRDVAPACPYAFLLQDPTLEPLSGHIAWLKTQKLLVPQELGAEALASLRMEFVPTGWAWNPLFAPALALLSQPRARLRIVATGKNGTSAASHVANDRAVMVAQINKTHCQCSDPLPLSDWMERLIQDIGVSGDSAPTPLRTDHKVLRVLGILAAAGVVVVGEKQTEPSSIPPLVPQIIDTLTSALEDRALASALLQDLVTDQLVTLEHGYVWFHTRFAPWHRAFLSGEQLEIHRLELPSGQLPTPENSATKRLFFLGTPGHRCLVWPVNDGSHEVILARPHLQDLRSFLAPVVGIADIPNPTATSSMGVGTSSTTTVLSHEQKTSKPRSRG